LAAREIAVVLLPLFECGEAGEVALLAGVEQGRRLGGAPLLFGGLGFCE